MAEYFVIRMTEDGGIVEKFESRKELEHSLADEDETLYSVMHDDEYPATFLEEVPGFGYIGDEFRNDVLVIKGTIVVPKPKEKAVVWEVD